MIWRALRALLAFGCRHEFTMKFDRDERRIWLECMRCGHESHGWSLHVSKGRAA